MRNIVFYTTAELTRVTQQLSEVTTSWIKSWAHDENKLIDIHVASYEEGDITDNNIALHSSNKLFVTAFRQNVSQISEFFIGNLTLLDTDIAQAMLKESLQELMTSIEAKLDTSFALQDITIHSDTTLGHGLLSIGLSAGNFELTFVCLPEQLRQPQINPRLKSVDLAQLLSDTVCELEVYLGESKVAAEDIYLLQPGDVIKLDQSLADTLLLKNRQGEMAGKGLLCASQGSLAIEITTGIIK